MNETETLPIHVFKDSFKPIIELLNKNNVKYQMREHRAGVVMASSGVLEIVLSSVIWGALASVVVTFIKSYNGRKVIITKKDGTIIHAEGLSKNGLIEVLKEANQISAIQPKSDNKDS